MKNLFDQNLMMRNIPLIKSIQDILTCLEISAQCENVCTSEGAVTGLQFVPLAECVLSFIKGF